jgi:hypothetical protein
MKRKLFNRRIFGSNVRAAYVGRKIGMRKAAKQAGISAATFSRVARGGVPSVEVYFRLVVWLSGKGE